MNHRPIRFRFFFLFLDIKSLRNNDGMLFIETFFEAPNAGTVTDGDGVYFSVKEDLAEGA